MNVLDELAGLSAAEDFFAALAVTFDPSVVRVARLHILRRMGQYLKDSEADGSFEALDDSGVRALCRAHLEQAYQDFVTSSPIEERLFKVHRDALQEKQQPTKAFVPLSSVVMSGSTK
jgi:nitrogenase-stabilizing/protective protein